MKKEIWRFITGFEGLYKASTYGRIKSMPREWSTGIGTRKHNGTILKTTNRNKYEAVSLYKNGKRYVKNVHVLIAQTFIPNPNNYLMVLHKIESIPQNNNVENLMWGTHEMNMKDMVDKKRTNKAKGEDAGPSKLKENQVIKIKKLLLESNLFRREIGEMFLVKRQTIDDIANGITWKHLMVRRNRK